MAIWDKLKDGIDKANKVAQDALDEGKVRMDARRARQSADKAAESLGYAVFRAWEGGKELEAESMDRLARALRDHEQEATRLERSIEEAAEWRRQGGAAQPAAAAPPEGAAAPPDGAAAPSEGAAAPSEGSPPPPPHHSDPLDPPPAPPSDDPSRPPV